MLVFWVSAISSAAFRHDIRTVAERLSLLSAHNHEQDVVSIVKDWLGDESNGQWLMILDNADDREAIFGTLDHSGLNPIELEVEYGVRQDARGLSRYLPQTGAGFIVVTSRNRFVAWV